MSHSKERDEKICLNCGALPLHDRYCHHCGQENVEPKQTVWHLFLHFFNDVTHFDGKFFSTLKLLLFKPGFLSAEYLAGRRAKYLDPIRMYLFISAMFFLVMFSTVGEIEGVKATDYPAIRFIDSVRNEESSVGDGLQFQMVYEPGYNPMSLFNVKDSLKLGSSYYDSIQHLLPSANRDDILTHYVNHKLADIYQVYDANPYNFVPNAMNLFLHSLSKIFFISLPLFAFFLYLLNARRRRRWYYVSHGIFTLHYYSVTFIFLLASLLLYRIDLPANAWSIILTILSAGLLIYLYAAMLRYYGQHWFKTLVKFLVLSVINTFAMVSLLFFMFLHAMASAH